MTTVGGNLKKSQACIGYLQETEILNVHKSMEESIEDNSQLYLCTWPLYVLFIHHV